MSWQTVAICEQHWREEEPGRDPVRFRDDAGDSCYRCGCPLHENVIYVRRDV